MIGALPFWFELSSLLVISGVLIADLLIIGRRPHIPGFAESARWVGLYVGLALLFAGAVALVGGATPATEFLAGWITEYSLSLDNLVVFALILTAFAVPAALQQRTLMIGILIALVLRAILIGLGAAVIERFTWVFFLFGILLLVTAAGMARSSDEEEEYRENAVVRLARRVLPISDQYDGARVLTRVPAGGSTAPDSDGRHDGGAHPSVRPTTARLTRRALTPLALVILALGTTDLLFALDSIPAILGITQDAFLVFATNLFALMGLRQLYFMLAGLMARLTYLRFGLAAVLAFIGVKLVLHALHTNSLPFLNGGEPIAWGPEISTGLSLAVIVGCLALAALASLLWHPRPGPEPAPDATSAP